MSEIETEDIQLVELFAQINRRMFKKLAAPHRESPLAITDMLVLWRINKLKSCHASTLANGIGIPASTLTGILDRLETQGFISRGADPSDRRSIVVEPTAKLAAFVRERLDHAESTMHSTFSLIPEERRHQLLLDLQTMLAGLEAETGKACE